MEHIYLATQHPVGAKRTTQRTFVQSSEIKGYRATFEIFNDHYLTVDVTKTKRRSSRYTIDLAFLDPKPLHFRAVDWRLIGAASVLLSVALATAAFLSHTAGAMLGGPWLPVAILTGTGACVCALIGLQRSSDKVSFYSQNGRIPLVELLNRNPGRDEYRDFMEDLVSRIQQARNAYPSTGERLAAELVEHRRLKEQGIIRNEDYAAVKDRILRSHERSGRKAAGTPERVEAGNY